MENTIAVLKKEVDPTKQLIKLVEKENAQLTNQISELMEKNQELNKKVKNIEYHLDSYKNDSDHFNRKINELKAQVTSKDQIIDELEMDNYQLRQTINDISKTKELGKRNIHYSNYNQYKSNTSININKDLKKDNNINSTEKITDNKKININVANIDANSSGDIEAFIQEYNKKLESKNTNNQNNKKMNEIKNDKKQVENVHNNELKNTNIDKNDTYNVYNSKKTRTRDDDFNGIGILSYTDDNINQNKNNYKKSNEKFKSK